MIGLGTVYMVINCMYSLIGGKPVYPGIDWVTLPSYLFIIASIIMLCGAFAINYYYWKLVKLPRILKK